jgi:putative FmdB family regulatory protein
MRKDLKMPTYEYVCECGNRVAIIRSMTEESVAPTCDCGKTMTRIWDTPGAIFKGGGWGGS